MSVYYDIDEFHLSVFVCFDDPLNSFVLNESLQLRILFQLGNNGFIVFKLTLMELQFPFCFPIDLIVLK